MITTTFSKLRQAKRDYPGILRELRSIENNPEPTVSYGITGRTILLASLTTKFSIVREAKSSHA